MYQCKISFSILAINLGVLDIEGATLPKQSWIFSYGPLGNSSIRIFFPVKDIFHLLEIGNSVWVIIFIICLSKKKLFKKDSTPPPTQIYSFYMMYY